jgi:hypothetical protein
MRPVYQEEGLTPPGQIKGEIYGVVEKKRRPAQADAWVFQNNKPPGTA